MLFLGTMVGNLSGSLGAITASRNKGGPYFRARATPVQPNSTSQQDVKARMSSLAAAWLADLTSGQRAAWNTYGENTPVANSIGESIFLTGQNWYVGNNVARLRAGLSRVDAGPTTYGLPELSLPGFEAESTPGATVTFTNTDLWATAVGGALLVQLSSQQNPTVNFYKAPFRFVAKMDGAVSPPASPLAISTGFPSALTTGNKLFARIRAATADGRLSAPVILSTTIVAPG